MASLSWDKIKTHSNNTKFLKEMLKDMKQTTVSGFQQLGESTSKVTKKSSLQVVSTSLYLLLRIPLFFLLIYLLISSLGKLFGLFNNYALSYLSSLSSVVGDFGVYWVGVISASLTIWVIFLFLLYLLIPLKEDTKETLQKITINIVMGSLIISLGYGYYTTTDYFNSNTSSEQTTDLLEDIQEKQMTFWEEITCPFKPGCVQEKYINSNKAEQVSRSSYSQELMRLPSSTVFSPQDLSSEYEVTALIESSGEFIINSISCFYYNKGEKILLKKNDNGGEGYVIDDTQGVEVPLQFSCGELKDIVSEQIITEEKKEGIKFTLVVEFENELESTYSQEIPVVNFEKLIAQDNTLSKDGPSSYLYLKNSLENLDGISKQHLATSPVLEVDNSIFKQNLPLLLGDGDARSISFPLSIAESKEDNLGKLSSITITSFTSPKALVEKEEFPELNTEFLVQKDSRFNKYLQLKENEESFSSSSQLVELQEMKYTILAKLTNELRTTITVKDPNYDESIANYEQKDTPTLINSDNPSASNEQNQETTTPLDKTEFELLAQEYTTIISQEGISEGNEELATQIQSLLTEISSLTSAQNQQEYNSKVYELRIKLEDFKNFN